jgi:AcrR family transcriptional regulator
MGDVAAHAGVSKALVLYHFTDKESLLVALVEGVGHGVIEREEAALSGRDAAHALDGYWQWLEAELERGDLRILRALADYESERVRVASRRIARNRRQVAAGHVASIFDRLSLTPRIPPDLLAETLVAFVDGLAGAQALEPDRDARPAFDALWLALLTLTE